MNPSSNGWLKNWQFWLLNGIGGVALLLVFLNILMFQGNRGMQDEVSKRQQFINQTVKLSQLNNQLIRSLAYLSATANDKEIKQVLTSHGISFTLNEPSSEKGKTSKSSKPASK